MEQDSLYSEVSRSSSQELGCSFRFAKGKPLPMAVSECLILIEIIHKHPRGQEMKSDNSSAPVIGDIEELKKSKLARVGGYLSSWIPFRKQTESAGKELNPLKKTISIGVSRELFDSLKVRERQSGSCVASKNLSTIVIQLVTARRDQNLEQNILTVVENLVAPPDRKVRLEIQEESISSFFAYDLFSFADKEEEQQQEKQQVESEGQKKQEESAKGSKNGGGSVGTKDPQYSTMANQVQNKLTRANAIEFFWLAVSTKNAELLKLSYQQADIQIISAIKHLCLMQNNIDSRIFADRPILEAELNSLFEEASVENSFLFDHRQKVKVGKGFYSQFKLDELLEVVEQERKQKSVFFTPRKHYTLFTVLRKRKENAALGDYPHLYKLVSEESGAVELTAIQRHQSGDFLIFQGEVKRTSLYIKHSTNYIAHLKAGFWGMSFELFDYGVERKLANSVLSGFLPERRKFLTISYERNILGECPRALSADLLDPKTEKVRVRLRNIAPVFNYQRGCYTLNFHGRAVKASARNFQMREQNEDYQNSEDGDVLLMHGKVSKNEFHLDFRYPISMVEAFGISLASISKKRLVS